jgi:hypothetical protein
MDFDTSSHIKGKFRREYKVNSRGEIDFEMYLYFPKQLGIGLCTDLLLCRVSPRMG